MSPGRIAGAALAILLCVALPTAAQAPCPCPPTDPDAPPTLSQSVNALWKLNDFGDGLYTFGVALAASVTTRVQVKLEFQNVYKARPPAPDVQSNDLAFLTALVYKV